MIVQFNNNKQCFTSEWFIGHTLQQMHVGYNLLLVFRNIAQLYWQKRLMVCSYRTPQTCLLTVGRHTPLHNTCTALTLAFCSTLRWQVCRPTGTPWHLFIARTYRLAYIVVYICTIVPVSICGSVLPAGVQAVRRSGGQAVGAVRCLYRLYTVSNQSMTPTFLIDWLLGVLVGRSAWCLCLR